jgi:archaetidylinositol phosphate synthase
MDGVSFREAQRVHRSWLAEPERKCLVWLAERTPRWVNPDHLTLLGLLAMLLAGLSYWLARWHSWALLLVILWLGVNWLGDSLDGTLARVRRQPRPRYGFYVDHVVDAFGTAFLVGGLTLSGYMSLPVAAGLLTVYLLLCIEVYLATHTLGTFRLSLAGVSPTELRLLICLGNLAVLARPTVRLLGESHRLYDVAGAIGIVVMALVLGVDVARNTLALYRAERIS